jgi:hypothetical protein
MWFVYDEIEGFFQFPTEEQATAYYNERLSDYRSTPAEEGQWDRRTDTLCMGKLTRVVELQMLDVQTADDAERDPEAAYVAISTEV